MNDFIDKIGFKRYLRKESYVICDDDKNFNLDALKKAIDKDFPPLERKNNRRYKVIYCYSLIEGVFQYPAKASNVLYIGKSRSEITNNKISLSYRFKHCKDGNDSKSNYCLRYYYKNKIPLLLEIYEIGNRGCIDKIESKLRNAFIRDFSSYPIADGASFKKSVNNMR